jgi:predicted DNA binding CopG/RHH family protein
MKLKRQESWGGESKSVKVIISESLYNRIKALAERKGISMSMLIANILLKEI